jgi:hypothetical protein
MHLHNPADTQALLGAEQADKGLLSTEIQLSRGTQAVMAVGGNAMFMYLVGVGAAEAEARREKVIMSQYEAIVNMTRPAPLAAVTSRLRSGCAPRWTPQCCTRPGNRPPRRTWRGRAPRSRGWCATGRSWPARQIFRSPDIQE